MITYLRCTGFFCLAIIKGPPNDIYCIIEEPSKHYFTEKVSYSRLRKLYSINASYFLIPFFPKGCIWSLFFTWGSIICIY